jgi:hypothetical protein
MTLIDLTNNFPSSDGMAKPKKGVKISDLAGLWEMSDKEAEEMKKSIEETWKTLTVPQKPVENKKRKTSAKKPHKKGFGTLKGAGPFTAEDELKTQT